MSSVVGRSQDREFMALHRLVRLGYRPVAVGENEIRAAFGMLGQKCVDIVATNVRGSCIVAECKGSDIPHAVEQLNSTVPFVKRRYPLIEPAIIRNASHAMKSTPIVEIGKGYKAKFLQYSNSHILVAPNGTEVTLNTGERVIVMFDLQ